MPCREHGFNYYGIRIGIFYARAGIQPQKIKVLFCITDMNIIILSQ